MSSEAFETQGRTKSLDHGITNLSSLRGFFIQLAMQERTFMALLAVGFLIVAMTYQTPALAMWVGFAFAGYSAVANDSIQTLGTFLSSNAHRSWWVLWLFIGGIFIATMTYGWVHYDGDVSYGRLSGGGFSTTPESFTFLQVAAPLFLLVLTRMRIPVSTTFLLLSAFATKDGLSKMLVKSMSGYLLAFTVAILVWFALAPLFRRLEAGRANPAWWAVQWLSSGALWAVWLMQDAANVAVYLPRQLSLSEFLGFLAVMFFGLGILFRLRGDRIQRVVTEKSNVVDVRPATMIDGVYALILYFFKVVNPVPMSTTWVFVGLLAGREVAISFTERSRGGKPMKEAFRLMGKDIAYVSLGLVVSLILAISVNADLRAEFFAFIGG